MVCLLALGAPSLVSAWATDEWDGFERDALAAERQTGFRVRSDFTAELNTDRGWAGDLNENVTVLTDRPFRIRFELESLAQRRHELRFGLQYRRNGADWMNAVGEDFPKPRGASPRLSIVSSAAYPNGAPTTDLLPGSDLAFRPGEGVSLALATTAWSGGNVHGEWEWPLVIRRFADGALTSDEGDTFEFRMAYADGTLLDSYVNPVLTVAVPDGHLGGTFVETPERIGPWEASNGDLYFIMEPAETDNLFMMVKSSDRGLTWREVDGANRPRARDLEGVASELVGHTIHILHQASSVHYHSFRTSDHPTHPDTWEIRSEPVASPGPPPTQAVSLAVRSDGSVLGVYAGPRKVHFRIRSTGGVWGNETVVDEGEIQNLSGPQAVLGTGDEVHLTYTADDGTVWYRRVRPNGTLTPRLHLATELGRYPADRISILPLVFIPSTNTVVVIYRLATGRLWERRIINHETLSAPILVSDRDVVQNAVDSHQTGADAVTDGTSIHVLFIERTSGSIYYTRTDSAGAWQPSTLQVDGIRGSWIRGALHARGAGPPVYGYVFDAGSGGGGGMNQFAETRLGKCRGHSCS